MIDRLKQLVSVDGTTGPMQAVWNGAVIAQSDRTVVVEGNHYFPPNDVAAEYLEPSDKRTVCPWKGKASYYDVVVDGQRNGAAAWYYPGPKPAAHQIKDHVAFWHGVKVKPVPNAPAA
ncbi:MAG TPA: DUF427 domain-containing protein [Pseudonocardiaceae bacterium]|nr:DUF427 domain-containing protein [Pseudonocardiaceae bacterium]